MERFPKDLTTVTPFSKAIAVIIICLGIVGAFYAGILYDQKQTILGQEILSNKYLVFFPKKIPSASKGSGKLSTVNQHWTDTKDPRSPYFTFQIKYPSKYVVTSDEMLESYKTQGGIAPPALVLTTQNQFLTTQNGYFTLLQNLLKSGKDCVLIWKTSGEGSIEDWRNLVGQVYNEKYSVLSKKTSKIGKYSVTLNSVKVTPYNTERTEAFVKFPQDVSYYFITCNQKSSEDLTTILENFDVRGNL